MMNVNELNGAEAMEPRAPVNNCSASIVTMIEQARVENRLVIENRRNDSITMIRTVPEYSSTYNQLLEHFPGMVREPVEAPEMLDFEDFEQVLEGIDQVADEAQQEAVNGNILLAIGLATLMYGLVEPGLASFDEDRHRVNNYGMAINADMQSISNIMIERQSETNEMIRLLSNNPRVAAAAAAHAHAAGPIARVNAARANDGADEADEAVDP